MIEIMSAPDETKPWLIENQAKNLMSFAYHLNSPGANIHLGLTLYAKICCIGIACCQTLWIIKRRIKLYFAKLGKVVYWRYSNHWAYTLHISDFEPVAVTGETFMCIYFCWSVFLMSICKGLSKGNVLWQLDNSSIINSIGTNHKKHVYYESPWKLRRFPELGFWVSTQVKIKSKDVLPQPLSKPSKNLKAM